MQKIISLNIEMHKHYDLVFPFLESEAPDIIALAEAPEEIMPRLKSMGYYLSFAPMFSGENSVIGLILASRSAQTTKTIWYLKDYTDANGTKVSYPCLLGDITTSEGLYRVGVIHGPVTKRGVEDEIQTESYARLLKLLAEEPSHVLCGDFNMPRGYNKNYNDFIAKYTDTIPQHYPSSMDRSLHRLGSDKNLDSPMFEAFMVDYLFTQSPFVASAVRLEFKVSDHAAIVANLSLKND